MLSVSRNRQPSLRTSFLNKPRNSYAHILQFDAESKPGQRNVEQPAQAAIDLSHESGFDAVTMEGRHSGMHIATHGVSPLSEQGRSRV
jgi:hypothetical protein